MLENFWEQVCRYTHAHNTRVWKRLNVGASAKGNETRSNLSRTKIMARVLSRQNDITFERLNGICTRYRNWFDEIWGMVVKDRRSTMDLCFSYIVLDARVWETRVSLWIYRVNNRKGIWVKIDLFGLRICIK